VLRASADVHFGVIGFLLSSCRRCSMLRLINRVRRALQERRPGRRARTYRPMLECFEERCVPATAEFLQTNLVSDIQGLALNFDPNLVNPWGLTASANGPFWVSDNNAGVSTLYNGQGVPQSLVVAIPQPDGSPGGAPTGVVFNSSPGFKVSENGVSGTSLFIFATEDGTIAGWSPGVDLNNAVIAVDNSGSGAVYKGLAIGQDPDGRTLLYAANFNAGTIEVYDRNFNLTTVGGDFTDPNIPAGFAPFNVQNLGGKLYVTYALQNDAKHDDVAGPGNGFVDVFDTNGHLLQRLASNGPLDSPWGVAIAPDNFGNFSGAVLVGNFGDGHINAFDPITGTSRGQLTDPAGNPIVIGGLWALRVGNGGAAGDPHTLFFTAGIDHENHGLFGQIQSIAPVTFDGAAGSAVLQTNLTSDLEGVSPNQDPNLLNPWGMVAGGSGPFWVSDNNAGVATLYNGQGQPQPSATNPLVVNIPLPDGTPGGSPTGVDFNGGGGFRVSENGATGSALFIFATEEGTISGWSPSVDLNNAILAVDNSGQGADYTGLTLGTDSDGRRLLYAANFGQGSIDVFDAAFLPTHTIGGSFTDGQIPDGFVPYNIQNLGGKLYVTYTSQDGSGGGFVDVFSTDGVLLQHLIANSPASAPLDTPWGVAIAPSGFGMFSNDLLVGNVADGHINAFNAQTGAFVAELKDGLGNPIAINGLWTLRFGNDATAGSSHTLFFTAGIGDYQHGLLGSLQVIDPIAVATSGAAASPASASPGASGLSPTSLPSMLTAVPPAGGDVSSDPMLVVNGASPDTGLPSSPSDQSQPDNPLSIAVGDSSTAGTDAVFAGLLPPVDRPAQSRCFRFDDVSSS
jgi:uncharacterized protein (TIGR03118 family)